MLHVRLCISFEPFTQMFAMTLKTRTRTLVDFYLHKFFGWWRREIKMKTLRDTFYLRTFCTNIQQALGKITLEMHEIGPAHIFSESWTSVIRMSFTRAMEEKVFLFLVEKVFIAKKFSGDQDFNRLLVNDLSRESCNLVASSEPNFFQQFRNELLIRIRVTVKLASALLWIISHSYFLSIALLRKCLSLHHQYHRSELCIQKACTWNQFSYSMFHDFWGAFSVFRVWCFAFSFFFCRLELSYWIFNIMIYSKQEVAKEISFIQFFSLRSRRTRKDISCRMWGSVLCKLQKSLSEKVTCFSFSASRWIKPVANNFIYFFHSTSLQTE